LFTLQASASVTLVARSSLEILASRQVTGVCASACADFSNTVDTCTTKACLCTTAVANSLQSCINCAVTNSPTDSVISAAQSLIDTYKSTCAGVINPTLTLPAGTPSPATTTRLTTSRITTPTSTTSRVVVTVTSPTGLTQTVIGPTTAADTTTPSPTSTGGIPNVITPNSSSKNSIQKAFVVSIGAMIGAALVL